MDYVLDIFLSIGLRKKKTHHVRQQWHLLLNGLDFMNRYKYALPLDQTPSEGQIWRQIMPHQSLRDADDLRLGIHWEVDGKYADEWDVDFLDPKTNKPYENRVSNLMSTVLLLKHYKRIF